MIRSDTVACQSISPSLPFCTPRPGAGWAPVLRKPGNTHFSGLNAQIPCAVTGHAFSEPIQSHKHGLEASLGPMDLGTVAHLKFQAEGWSVREAPAGTRQAGGSILPCSKGPDLCFAGLFPSPENRVHSFHHHSSSIS